MGMDKKVEIGILESQTENLIEHEMETRVTWASSRDI